MDTREDTQAATISPALEAEAEALLHRLAGPEARFREHQLEAVRDLVEDRARVLCVQRTGWGKSAVYFLATALLRERGAGPALIVSPLLALMRNQIAAAERLGIRAHTINSTNRDEWDEVRALLADDAVDLLLISPERLNNPRFREDMLPLFAERVGLVVVDEAHCISRLGPRLPARLPAAARTARAAARRASPCSARPRRRTTAWSPTSRSSSAPARAVRTYRGAARALAACASRSSSCRARPTGWRGWRRGCRSCRAPGIVYTLTKRDAERRRRVADARGIAGRGLQRRGRDRAARGGRGPPAAQRAQGRRRHERARHGLRQARPRLRRALPGAGLGDRLLPAGRPRRPRRRARRGRAAARRRGPPDPGLLHRAGVPARASSSSACSRTSRRRRGRRDDARADGRGQPRAAGGSRRC